MGLQFNRVVFIAIDELFTPHKFPTALLDNPGLEDDFFQLSLHTNRLNLDRVVRVGALVKHGVRHRDDRLVGGGVVPRDGDNVEVHLIDVYLREAALSQVAVEFVKGSPRFPHSPVRLARPGVGPRLVHDVDVVWDHLVVAAVRPHCAEGHADHCRGG